MNLTVKMIAYFMLVVLISAVGFAVTVYEVDNSRKLITATQQEDLPRLLQMADIARNIENKFAAIRGFLLSGDEVSLNNFRRATVENEKHEMELLATARTEQGKKMVSEIQAMDREYSDKVENVVLPLKLDGKEQEARQVMNGELTNLGRQLRAKVREFIELQRGQRMQV